MPLLELLTHIIGVYQVLTQGGFQGGLTDWTSSVPKLESIPTTALKGLRLHGLLKLESINIITTGPCNSIMIVEPYMGQYG